MIPISSWSDNMSIRDRIKRKISDKDKLVESLLEWSTRGEGSFRGFIKNRPLLSRLLTESNTKVLNRDECVGNFRDDLKSCKENR